MGQGEVVDSLHSDFAEELLKVSEPPCLSLYQPTHRHHPENQQDPIRFRNLVRALGESLLRKYPAREIQPLLDPLLALADDRDFWNHTLTGWPYWLQRACSASTGSNGRFPNWLSRPTASTPNR